MICFVTMHANPRAFPKLDDGRDARPNGLRTWPPRNTTCPRHGPSHTGSPQLFQCRNHVAASARNVSLVMNEAP
ncbi:hypothetical protein BGZ61DRAFT_442825 [Ilyonectria robusta]|uniref:uncharacterized protein n=1 Tax=Ilyonectria robusta TaxID=1079257 RepID=UPI001E8DD363|nr:uncharacterized protein BGZ61DRAFT_442825 [Ilyonectria robusta]KAH8734613.1 hypothetical protein BGZ61DRAFT_442825 [Ilyonectria robusta]